MCYLVPAFPHLPVLLRRHRRRLLPEFFLRSFDDIDGKAKCKTTIRSGRLDNSGSASCPRNFLKTK